jgi:hypothetical protein
LDTVESESAFKEQNYMIYAKKIVIFKEKHLRVSHVLHATMSENKAKMSVKDRTPMGFAGVSSTTQSRWVFVAIWIVMRIAAAQEV